MKHILVFTICFVLALLVAIPSCKKNRDASDARATAKNPPFARAGDDFFVQLLSCSDRTGSAQLDGSASSDRDGNIASFNWTKIYGPPGEIIRNSNTAKATVENVSPGEYAFELAVNDLTGLVSRDTLVMNVTGQPKEYDIDITFSGAYLHKDSVASCTGWYYYYSYNCDAYYRSTTILGQGIFSPVGEFTINVSEQENSDETGIFRKTLVHIFLDNINSVFISGNCTVNFGSLVKQGGGSFNGTLQINNGSALACDPDVFASLPALSVSGNIDVAAQNVVLRVQGKVYL